MSSQPSKQILDELTRAPHAPEELLPLVYDQLRAIAGSYFRRQPMNHTLQPTALVHEAYAQLAVHADAEWEGRAHFLAVAAKAMRDLLVDHTRRRLAAKRGGGRARVTLCDAAHGFEDPVDALDIDEALTALAQRNARQARVAEMRFFGGMNVQEVSTVLDVSVSTVEDDWRVARAWLSARLRGNEAT